MQIAHLVSAFSKQDSVIIKIMMLAGAHTTAITVFPESFCIGVLRGTDSNSLVWFNCTKLDTVILLGYKKTEKLQSS